MRTMKEALKWCMAAVLAVALPVSSSFAFHQTVDPVTTPGTDKKPHIKPVPQGIPDRTPYGKFDPPRSSMFDINKLTVMSDLRIRPEMRNNAYFGIQKANDFFVQQWNRLGFNYGISPDVDLFFQAQYSKNWGAASLAGAGNAAGSCAAGICANDPFQLSTGNSLFVRQAYVLLRNVGIENLSFKLGRQLVIFGNHRLFGSFDWANTGFSHDGITLNYSSKMFELYGGWLRPADYDFTFGGANSTEFGVIPPGLPTSSAASANEDADIYYARPVFKPMAGLSIEPMWVWFINSTRTGFSNAGTTTNAHAPNQQRHTLGGRVVFKKGVFDLTYEGYWQTGSQGASATGPRNLTINAHAHAAMAGVTLPVPMQPRLGFEFNFASGDSNAINCSNNTSTCTSANTFENLFPTNHILMGYMDLFAWRNMVGYSGNFQIRPTKDSHLEIAGWVFRRATNGDNWYRAAQNVYFTNVGNQTNSSSLGQEIDVIFTKYFMNNHVGWQIGYGHFFAGQFVDQVAAANGVSGTTGQEWGYTQIHVNF